MGHGTRRGAPGWFAAVVGLLVAVTLLRASLLQYLVPPSSVWNLARIGFGFALFALTMQFGMAMTKVRGRMLRGAGALAIPIVFVSIVRFEEGASHQAVLAGALVALAGGAAGAVIGAALTAPNAAADG